MIGKDYFAGEESYEWLFLRSYDGKKLTFRAWVIPGMNILEEEETLANRKFRELKPKIATLWYDEDAWHTIEDPSIRWFAQSK
jgi:hypothetical protein